MSQPAGRASKLIDQASEKRLIAAEIIRQLYEAGEKAQLELLKAQAEVSLEHLDRKRGGK